MALPTFGVMKMGADVGVELGNTSTSLISLGSSSVRTLYGISSGAIRLAADGYGKSSITYAIFATTGFQTWTVPSGVTKIKTAEAIAGGANGGGAYAKSTDIAVTPGQTIYLRVGTGLNFSTLVPASNSWVNISSNTEPSTTSQGVLAICPDPNLIGLTVGQPGGQASGCIGTTKYSGGKGGTVSSFGGQGGGGAAGPNADGAAGGNPGPSASGYYAASGGGGGGGANGGSVGSNATDAVGGNGGNGQGGSGGGTGSSTTTKAGDATTNSGAGGGGGWGGIGQGTGGFGGNGAMYPISIWGNYGPGGGGGGFGHLNPFGGGGAGGNGGLYGGGGGGGGGNSGAQGIVVIAY